MLNVLYSRAFNLVIDCPFRSKVDKKAAFFYFLFYNSFVILFGIETNCIIIDIFSNEFKIFFNSSIPITLQAVLLLFWVHFFINSRSLLVIRWWWYINLLIIIRCLIFRTPNSKSKKALLVLECPSVSDRSRDMSTCSSLTSSESEILDRAYVE